MKARVSTLENYSALAKLETPKLGTRVARGLVILLVLFLAIMLLPWQQNISGFGQVLAFNPENRPQTVQNIIPGQILRWYIVEGQTVNKGDTLVHLGEVKDEYFDPRLAFRLQEQIAAKKGYMAATRQQIEMAGDQLVALRSGLELSLNKGGNKVVQGINKIVIDSANLAAERVQFDLSRRQLIRYEELYSKNGLISLTELEKRRLTLQEKKAKLIYADNVLLNTKQDLLTARIELGSIRAEYQDKIAKTEGDRAFKASMVAEAEKELSMLENKAANVLKRQTQYYLIAPQKGFVSKVLKAGIGEVIKEAEPVVTIVPDETDLAVEIFIRPMDLPLVKKGQEVRIEFDGYPAFAFSGWQGAAVGTFGGKVAVVDRVADSKGNYRLIIRPDAADAPWPEAIRIGGGARGWAMLNNVQVWYEVWREFNGFPPDHEKTLDSEQTTKK